MAAGIRGLMAMLMIMKIIISIPLWRAGKGSPHPRWLAGGW
jgi:hypothetical protein